LAGTAGRRSGTAHLRPDRPGQHLWGGKELNPDGWSFATENGGANPKGANILDIYRAVDHPTGGDAFLYLAFTREASSGSQSLTLELNQDATKWRNSTGTEIPRRKTGDILISFLEHGNGVSVQVDRWVTDHANPATGCTEDGHLDSASGLTPDVDVQGSWNDSGIHNYLPPLSTTTIDEPNFGEAAINLTKWLSVIGQPCGVVASTWAHSRASDEVQSDMKDYVAPSSFRVPVKACPDLRSSASGKVNRKARGKHRLRRHKLLGTSTAIWDTATLSGGDNPTGTIIFKLFGPDNANCSGTPIFTGTKGVSGNGSYESAKFPVTQPGTYRWVVEYSGDTNNHAAGPTACGKDTETVVISMASPTLTSKASGPTHLERIGVGPRGRQRFRIQRVHVVRATEPIIDIATLSDGIAPTGTLTFRLYGPNNSTCSGDPIFTSPPVTVDGNGTYNSDPFTPEHAGIYRWTVKYSGDNLNHPAGPTECGIASETIDVGKATPDIKTEASPPVDVGHPITDDATLSGGAHPTGKITFKVYGPDNADCSGGTAGT
jgi:hypothetical protein